LKIVDLVIEDLFGPRAGAPSVAARFNLQSGNLQSSINLQ
jgi:hypothetical protein